MQNSVDALLADDFSVFGLKWETVAIFSSHFILLFFLSNLSDFLNSYSALFMSVIWFLSSENLFAEGGCICQVVPHYMINIVHGSLHTKELHRSLIKEVVDSAVSLWGKPQKPSQTHLGRWGADSEPPPNSTGGVSLSVVYPHKAHQGQQLFVWANPNYSLDRHEKASALTSNTKSLKYKGFHFFLCFRCQRSRRSAGPKGKRRKDNGI